MSSSPAAGARHRAFVPIFAVILAGCGNEPAAATPPQPSEAPAVTPDTTAPTPEATDTTKAKAKPSAPPEAEAKPQGSGRPAVLKSDPSEITDTFGSSPASKLELGDKEIATLRLPEGALGTGTLITFKIDAKGKATGGQIGKIYRINAVFPPSSTPEAITSSGPPFVIELPAGARKDANLAVGVEDDKGKVKWSVVAPKRVDDARKVAIFELAALPSAWLHITTKPPAGEK